MSSQPDSFVDEEASEDRGIDLEALRILSKQPGAVRALVDAYAPGLMDARMEVHLIAEINDAAADESDEFLDQWRLIIQRALVRLLKRIPVFMYLTDDRPASLTEIIMTLDRELFEKVTGVPVHHLASLVLAGLISARTMNPAIWHFRRFELNNIAYTGGRTQDEMMGIWEAVAGQTEPHQVPGQSSVLGLRGSSSQQKAGRKEEFFDFVISADRKGVRRGLSDYLENVDSQTSRRNAWETGAVVLPSADFTKLRQLLQHSHQQHQERVYELTQMCWRNLTRHEQDRPHEYRAAVEMFLAENTVDNRRAVMREGKGPVSYVTRPWRDLDLREARELLLATSSITKPARVQKGEMEFPSNRTFTFRADESAIAFDRETRTVRWSIESQSGTFRKSDTHPLMQAFKVQLREIRWTNETGGIVERPEGVVSAYGPSGAELRPDKCLPYTTSRGEKVTLLDLERMTRKQSRMAS